MQKIQRLQDYKVDKLVNIYFQCLQFCYAAETSEWLVIFKVCMSIIIDINKQIINE